MKRIMTLCLLIAMVIGGVQAQKGMQGVGVNLAGNVSQGGGIGIGVKYHYNLNNNLRLEPSFSYYAVNDHAFDYAALLNLHIFVLSPRAIRPYFFIGGGFVDYLFSKGSLDDKSMNGFGHNVGLGLDWRIIHDWSMQIEIGTCGMVYSGLYDRGAAKFNLGLTYNF